MNGPPGSPVGFTARPSRCRRWIQAGSLRPSRKMIPTDYAPWRRRNRHSESGKGMESDQKGAPMRTLRAGLTALVGATLVLVALPGIASAATTGTTTTFTLTGGSISITVPSTTVNLGSVSVAAGSITAQLGTVTVNDGRGLLNGSWTSMVSSSQLTTGGQTAA